MKDGDGMTAFMYAAEKNKKECVNALLDKEKNMKDNNGKTALMFAAEKGKVECVKVLA